MTRRSWATVVATCGFILVLLVLAFARAPFVIQSPGPSLDILGKFDKKQVITVQGQKSYRDKGQLRMLTVSPTGPDDRVSFLQALYAWVSPSSAVYPYKDIYRQGDTAESVHQQSQAQMGSSQDQAIAAALRELGYKFPTAVKVGAVVDGSPANGHLEAGDTILSVDGAAVTNVESVRNMVSQLRPGTLVTFKVRRAGRDAMVPIITGADPQDEARSQVGITMAPSYRFPFQVNIHLSSNIGGPSAGMMFAVAIYDLLTPGSLTKNKVIAGTGEITATGKVGSIGGIQQKIVGAERSGAKLFLAPAANCDEVRGANWDRKKMKIVRVTTLNQAIKDVKAWTADPTAKLPGCTK